MGVPRVEERYVSFEQIDCFENACKVVDNLLRVTRDEKYNNLYWQKVIPNLPAAYYSRNPEEDKSEVLLYFVCSNVFYLEELFEKADDEDGINALRVCELECC